MLDTPDNRLRYCQRARKEKLHPGKWVKAWFATAERDGQKHFIVHGLTTKARRDTHFNLSGVPCKDFGLLGNYLAGEKELRDAGFATNNFDGSDTANEITFS